MKKILTFLSILFFIPTVYGMSDGPLGSTPVSRNSTFTGPCRINNATCHSSTVRVDIATKCMCIGRECFKVGTAPVAWKTTVNGTSHLGLTSGVFDRVGGRYRTRSNTTTAYDDDALAMGIPGNDSPIGKWFHKPAGCQNAETYPTIGCVAVPCNKWPLLKSQIGAEVTICGGNPPRNGRLNHQGGPPPRLAAMVDRVTTDALEQARGVAGVKSELSGAIEKISVLKKDKVL